MQQSSSILAKRLKSKSTKSIESIVVRAKSIVSSKGRRVDEVDRVDCWPSQVDRIHSTRSTAGYIIRSTIFTNSDHRARMDQLLNKLNRYGFLPQLLQLCSKKMTAMANDSLFMAIITNQQHVLRSFLPRVTAIIYELGPTDANCL